MSSTPPRISVVASAPHVPVVSTVHRIPVVSTVYDTLMRPRVAIISLGWFGLILWAAVILAAIGLALT